jgi:hypothetical protein
MRGYRRQTPRLLTQPLRNPHHSPAPAATQ